MNVIWHWFSRVLASQASVEAAFSRNCQMEIPRYNVTKCSQQCLKKVQIPPKVTLETKNPWHIVVEMELIRSCNCWSLLDYMGTYLLRNGQCNFSVAIASIFYKWKIKKHVENHTSVQKLAKKLEMGTWWENIDRLTHGILGHGDLSISEVNSQEDQISWKNYSSCLVLFNWPAQIQSGLSMHRDRSKKNKTLPPKSWNNAQN